MKKKTLTLGCLFLSALLSAQEKNTTQSLTDECTVSYPFSFKVTQSPNLLLSDKNDQPKYDDSERERKEMENRKENNVKLFTIADGAQYGNDGSTIQEVMGTRQSLGVIKKWEGLSNNSQPLDPSGAAGMTQYVQAVNVTPFAVYDKTGTGTPVFNGSIGSVTGTGASQGDPIVIYDKFADRWVVLELDGGTDKFGIAVSKTNDPTGLWNAYSYAGVDGLDYLKLGVWSDGYYITANNNTTQSSIIVLERAAMIAGTPNARMLKASFAAPAGVEGGIFWAPMPGDADGLIPPSGLRFPMFSHTENSWGSGNIDGVKVWSVGTTWGGAPSANVSLDATIPVAAFDGSFGWGVGLVQQPGSLKLDIIGRVSMFRAQWNSFIGTNRVALNWPVKISANQYSIKWVELRQDQTTKTWSLYQEGIYTPDASNRWLGSIAMDCNGNIGLAYAKTSSSVPMCLAYTGRLTTDPLGTMSIAETVVFPGTGSIPGVSRIGDYAHTSIDPANPTTFWHTGTYCNNARKTGIFSFQLATSCLTTDVAENSSIEARFFTQVSGNHLLVRAENIAINNNYTIQLFEISGKLLAEKSILVTSDSFESTININDLVSGVYLLRIGTPEFQKVIKITL